MLRCIFPSHKSLAWKISTKPQLKHIVCINRFAKQSPIPNYHHLRISAFLPFPSTLAFQFYLPSHQTFDISEFCSRAIISDDMVTCYNHTTACQVPILSDPDA